MCSNRNDVLYGRVEGGRCGGVEGVGYHGYEGLAVVVTDWLHAALVPGDLLQSTVAWEAGERRAPGGGGHTGRRENSYDRNRTN